MRGIEVGKKMSDYKKGSHNRHGRVGVIYLWHFKC